MKVSIDSRTIKPGDYFIPVKGLHFDGRQFIEEALEKGGHLLDVNLETYAASYRKKLTCPVVAIVGSSGKTTIKDMLYGILSGTYQVIKTEENNNNEIGVSLTLLSADFKTDILLVEMGMRKKGDLSTLARLVRPSHVVFTGVGLAHVEFFKNQRELAKSKLEIFRSSLTWETYERVAFINYNSPFYDQIYWSAKRVGYKVFPYQGDTIPEQTINACYLIGQHFNVTDSDIRKGLSLSVLSNHRLSIKELGTLTLVDDSYNANPEGVLYLLQYSRRWTRRKILVLGDMLELGGYVEKAHQDIIDYAIDNHISIILTVGELTEAIHSEDIMVYHFTSKKALHQFLVIEIKEGDVVLVKGSRALKMEETVQFLESHYA